MTLLEKYRINKYRLMLNILKKYGYEGEILNTILLIDQKGTTFIDGKNWEGFIEENGLIVSSFRIKISSFEREFQIKTDNKELILNFKHWAGYFYKHFEKKVFMEKSLKDNTIIKVEITERDKKIFQDGIEYVNAKDYIKQSYIIVNNKKELFVGENISKNKIAIRNQDGTILIDEKKKTDKKEIRTSKLSTKVPITKENIASIDGNEIDSNIFDEYMAGNRKVLNKVKNK